MKDSFGGLKRMGRGAEKNVYNDPGNEKRVIAEIRNSDERIRTPRQVKARFYLTKILHLLYPTFIPDIHAAISGETDTLSMGKKTLDAEHLELNRLREKVVAGHPTREEETRYREQLRKGEHKLSWDDAFMDYFQEIESLGVNFDPSPVNFGHDENSHLVYVDNSFEPWTIFSDGNIKKRFSAEKIREKINGLGGAKKDTAMSYLARLETLYEEDMKELGQ